MKVLGRSKAKETQELCKKPNAIGGDMPLAWDAVLSDFITVPSHITHMENKINMLMVLINLGHD